MSTHPFIHIEQRPDPDDDGAFQLHVKAGAGISDTDQIVTLLLRVVEQITGVSPDLYAKEIDIARRVARGGPLFPADLDHEEQP